MGTTSDGSRKIWKWTYSGTLTTSPTGIIFVTDGQQTSDLTFYNHGYYIDGNYHHTVTNYTSPAPTLSIDKASGQYEGSVTVTITASESDAVIVYTTNGTTPTASSPQATGQVKLTFTDNTVLTAGVLHDGKVRNIVQREYICPLHGHRLYQGPDNGAQQLERRLCLCLGQYRDHQRLVARRENHSHHYR